MVEVDEGVVYGPIGGGYSTARTSVQSRMLADRYRQLIAHIENYVRENTDTFIANFREHGLEPENKPRFQLLVDKNGLHVLEMGSKVAFLVHPNDQG